MNSFWLASYIALWVIVALLTLVVVLLARQLGLIYRRLGAAPARMENDGPVVGELAPEVHVQTLEGKEATIGGIDHTKTLLVFLSVGCPSCNRLAPAIRSVWKRECNEVETLIVSLSNNETAVRDFLNRNNLHDVPCVISNDLVQQYNINSPPYGVLLDENGVVRAKGVVNNLDHIESLLNAAEIGHPTVSAYLNHLSRSPDHALAIE